MHLAAEGMKGVSPIISLVMLVVLVFFLGTIVTVWTVEVTRNVTNITSDVTTTKVECQYAEYDFDYDYASKGVNHSFSGASDYLYAMMQNTGTVNLYNFSVQAWVNNGGEITVYDLEVNETTQKTSANPLKPGHEALVNAVISVDINGTLTLVRVNNLACKDEYAEQEF
jgi:flagellin-like protein